MMQDTYQSKRRKRRPAHNLKTVEVTRGKTGYGFTISGQHPCVLSCIVSGSPAETNGLRPGDYLLCVNGENVSKYGHDDVVRMIGQSTGTLFLQVAENYNSSDSSDDEYHARPKSRHPNRVRSRHVIGMSYPQNHKVFREQNLNVNQNARKSGSIKGSSARDAHVNGYNHEHVDRHNDVEVVNRPISRTSQHRVKFFDKDTASDTRHRETRGNHIIHSHGDLHGAKANKYHESTATNKTHSATSLRRTGYQVFQTNSRPGVSPGGPAFTPLLSQNMKSSSHIINDNCQRVRLTDHCDPPAESNIVNPENLNQPSTSRMFQISETDDIAVVESHHGASESSQHSSLENNVAPLACRDKLLMRVLVGYMGSIEMPNPSAKIESRLHLIRNVVRRLRIEQKVHIFTLMEIYTSGVKLKNTLRSVIAEYPTKKLAFSGICPDDKRFFGLVTFQADNDDDTTSMCSNGDIEKERNSVQSVSTSCHVFMVDPDLHTHCMHSKKAKMFGIECTRSENQTCQEFPQSATSIIPVVSKLYKGRTGVGIDTDIERSNALADPAVAEMAAADRYPSSNSDSGLGGAAKDESIGRNDPVYVVDVNPICKSEPKASHVLHENALHSSTDLQHLSPDVKTMPTPKNPLHQSILSQDSLDVISVASSDEYVEMNRPDFMNIRATTESHNSHNQSNSSLNVSRVSQLSSVSQPDVLCTSIDDTPICRRSDAVTIGILSTSVDGLEDTRLAAEDMRRTMHRFMQARQYISEVTATSSRSNANRSPTPNSQLSSSLCLPPSKSFAQHYSRSHSHSQVPLINGNSQLNLRNSSSSINSEHAIHQTPVSLKHTIKNENANNSVLTIDMSQKLSPRAYLPLGPTVQSPCAPPSSHIVKSQGATHKDNEITKLDKAIDQNHEISPDVYIHENFLSVVNEEDFDADDDESMDSKMARLDKDHAEQMTTKNDVTNSAELRRFSEGFALSKQREKGRSQTAHDDLSSWTKAGSFRRHKSLKQQPLSHSHESLFATEAENDVSNTSNQGTKLITAGSVNSVLSNNKKSSCNDDDGGRVARWAVNFDKLLHDSVGLAVFTESLRKEFSEENINFWSAVQEFRKISDRDKRKARAKDLFDSHLSCRATDPVNIDSSARSAAEKLLDMPTAEMFDMAQGQIFQLMKQDCYTRFLKSELYKSYLMAEIDGKPLLLPNGVDPTASTQTQDIAEPSEKSKDKPLNDDKRRRSLLPWVKAKPVKQNGKKSSDSELRRVQVNIQGDHEEVNNNIDHRHPPSMVNVDLSLMGKEVQRSETDEPSKESQKPEPPEQAKNRSNHKFCRVILPDGSTTVVFAKPGQTIRAVFGKLCEKRNLSVAAIEVYLLGSEKPLNLNDDISVLGSKEVVIERRVLFRMDLPNHKSIGVRAKPNRPIRDVFKPILHKYGYKIESVSVHLVGKTEIVNLDIPTSTLEGNRVVILPRQDIFDRDANDERRDSKASRVPPLLSGTLKLKSHHRAECARSTMHSSTPSLNGNDDARAKQQTTNDSITNAVFEDLMQGKSQMAHSFDELGVLDPHRRGGGGTKNEKNPAEPRLSGLSWLRKRESMGQKDPGKSHPQAAGSAAAPALANKPPVTHGRSKAPVLSHLQKSESKKAGKADPEDEKFFDLLARVQSHRLDNQRGLEKIDFELPEFLQRPVVQTDSKSSDKENSPNALNREDSISSNRFDRADSLRSSITTTTTTATCSTAAEELSIDDLDTIDLDTVSQFSDREVVDFHESVYSTADCRSLRSFRTFGSPSDRIAFLNQSFTSADGVVPSHDEATSYFDMFHHPIDPDFNDSTLMEKTLTDIGLANVSSGNCSATKVQSDSFKKPIDPPRLSSKLPPLVKRINKSDSLESNALVPPIASPETLSPNSISGVPAGAASIESAKTGRVASPVYREVSLPITLYQSSRTKDFPEKSFVRNSLSDGHVSLDDSNIPMNKITSEVKFMSLQRSNTSHELDQRLNRTRMPLHYKSPEKRKERQKDRQITYV